MCCMFAEALKKLLRGGTSAPAAPRTSRKWRRQRERDQRVQRELQEGQQEGYLPCGARRRRRAKMEVN